MEIITGEGAAEIQVTPQFHRLNPNVLDREETSLDFIVDSTHIDRELADPILASMIELAAPDGLEYSLTR